MNITANVVAVRLVWVKCQLPWKETFVIPVFSAVLFCGFNGNSFASQICNCTNERRNEQSSVIKYEMKNYYYKTNEAVTQ